jgi:hypothetical protein
MRITHYLVICLLVALPTYGYAASFACPDQQTAKMSDGSRLEFHGADPAQPTVCMWNTVRLNAVSQSRFIFAMQNEYATSVFEPDQIRQMLEVLFKPSSQGLVSATLNNGNFKSSIRTVMKLSHGTVTVPAGTFNVMIVQIEGNGVFENEAHVVATYYLDEVTHVPVQINEDENGTRYKLLAVDVTKGH